MYNNCGNQHRVNSDLTCQFFWNKVKPYLFASRYGLIKQLTDQRSNKNVFIYFQLPNVQVCFFIFCDNILCEYTSALVCFNMNPSSP